MKNEDAYKKEIFKLSKDNLIRENEDPTILVLLEKLFLDEMSNVNKDDLLKDILADE